MKHEPRAFLDMLKTNGAILVRPKGDPQPFKVMCPKTGKLVSNNEFSLVFVKSLQAEGWLAGGQKELVESYQLSDEGKKRLAAKAAKQTARDRLRQFRRGPDLDTTAIKGWQQFQLIYERACIEDPRFASWDQVLEPGNPASWGPFNGTVSDGSEAADLRSAAAFIGPDLSNAILMFYCRGENLEAMEKRLSWPARSGKLVVAIAARKLADYYCVR